MKYMDEMNIFCYQFSKETAEKIRSGEAVLGTGGAKLKNGTMLEMAKPAIISKSVNGEISTELQNTDETSIEALEEIRNTGVLTNSLLNKTCDITIEGFKQTLCELDYISTQVSELSHQVKQLKTDDLLERFQRYRNYLSSDAGKMEAKSFNVTNSNISDHLDEIASFIKSCIAKIGNNAEEGFFCLKTVFAIINPFSYTVKKYSSLYYYENGILPGNYDEWLSVIDNVINKNTADLILYYLRLKTDLGLEKSLYATKQVKSAVTGFIDDIRFAEKYIACHSKEEYLSIAERYQKKIEAGEYIISDDGKIIIEI